MTQNNKTRIGVIGVGFGTAVHIPAFQDEGLEVVAVCSRRQERASEAAGRFGIPKIFTDYNEMISMDGLDAVSIVSPPALHYEMTMAALRAGKHVICEKPFARNQSQAREMMELAQSQGVTAMIAHEFRFTSGRALVKELVEQGYLGQLRMVNIGLFLGRRQPAQTSGVRPVGIPAPASVSQGGGFLFGLGSHYIDCLRDWFGEIDGASGRLYTHIRERLSPNTDPDAEADNAFHFHLSFKNGGWAAMTGTLAAPFGSGANIEVYGDEGTLVTPQPGVNPPSNGIVRGALLGEEGVHELVMPERLRPPQDSRDDRLPPFRVFVQRFLEGIRTGTSPAPNFYDGYRCQQVLDAIVESHRTGRWVDIALS